MSCSTICILLVTWLCFSSLTPTPIDAAFPNIDFNALSRYTQTPTGTGAWCTQCAAFSTNGQCPIPMGCAGDSGGGGKCPEDACPRVFTFQSQNNIPIWNIRVAVNPGNDPYRTFSYIPLCYSQNSQCTEPFFFSFSVKYIPDAGATMPIFNGDRDYLKLLFWGDDNNILGVKQGQLLGVPNGGGAYDRTTDRGGDLVGKANIGEGEAFKTPFPVNTWINVATRITFANNRATLAFFVNGQPMGITTKSVGTSNSGLQFGAYTWGGTFYTLQYTNIAITAASAGVPNPVIGGAATVAPTTIAPATTAPPTRAPATRPPTSTTTTAPAATPRPGAPAATTRPGATSAPGTGLIDSIVVINPPTSIPQFDSFPIQILYSAKSDYSLVAEIVQSSTEGYQVYGTGFVNVRAGTRATVPITITITNILTPGLFYTINYYMVDSAIYQGGANINAYQSATVTNTFSVMVLGTMDPTTAPGNGATRGTLPPTRNPNANGITPRRNSATSMVSGSILSLSLVICSVIVLFL